MYTVTLITNPAMYLDPALVANLRNAMGGGDAVWLDPNHAAEFEVARLPKNLPSVWDSLQAEGVDLVAQPSVGRKKRMLLADMDSTMIRQECIDELADQAGVRRGGQRHHQTRHERGAGFRGRAARTGRAVERPA
jgi:phosphoserine phosphatase